MEGGGGWWGSPEELIRSFPEAEARVSEGCGWDCRLQSRRVCRVTVGVRGPHGCPGSSRVSGVHHGGCPRSIMVGVQVIAGVGSVVAGV